jgi:hypothetical protein
MLVIPATPEVNFGRISVQGQHGQKAIQIPSQEKKNKRLGIVVYACNLRRHGIEI